MARRMHARHAIRAVIRRVGIEPVRIAPGASLLGLHLHQIFAIHGVRTVLDVGARDGQYGLWLRANGFRGHIVSFEPVAPGALMQAAEADGNWEVVPIALGAQNGEADIHVARMAHLSSLRLPSTGAAWLGDLATIERTEMVSVRRLDSLWKWHNVYLKLDTQGSDVDVLAGLGEHRPSALQIEVAVQPIYEGAPTMLESLQVLADMGYALSGLYPVNLDARMAAMEFDCVAVR